MHYLEALWNLKQKTTTIALTTILSFCPKIWVSAHIFGPVSYTPGSTVHATPTEISKQNIPSFIKLKQGRPRSKPMLYTVLPLCRKHPLCGLELLISIICSPLLDILFYMLWKEIIHLSHLAYPSAYESTNNTHAPDIQSITRSMQAILFKLGFSSSIQYCSLASSCSRLLHLKSHSANPCTLCSDNTLNRFFFND